MNNRYPALIPVSRAAKKAVEHRTCVRMHALPFNISRDSRLGCRWGHDAAPGRRNDNALPDNDLLYRATDGQKALNVSRTQLQIKNNEQGDFELVDRGSTRGTWGGGKHIGGGHKGGRIALRDGDRIAMGLPDSPIVFEFRASVPAPRPSRRRKRRLAQCVHLFLFGIAPLVASALAIGVCLHGHWPTTLRRSAIPRQYVRHVWNPDNRRAFAYGSVIAYEVADTGISAASILR